MKNQIVVAMDMEIPEGIRLISKLRTSEKIYGYKIGSLWILDRGMDILKTVRDMLKEVNSSQKIILDMQKWGTDIPDIVKKQVEKVAPFVGIVNAVVAIRDVGGICNDCIVVVDRQEGAEINCSNNGISLHSVLKMEDFELNGVAP